tara:strand:+ start:1431 stop:2543 length:1113 start_codon:yes stop_codon:yes gene_type:complete
MACPIRTEVYGGLPSSGGFGAIREFGVGLQLIFEAAHCLLGSLGKLLGPGGGDWKQALFYEDEHLREEAGIILSSLHEYSRPIYRKQMTSLEGYRPEYAEKIAALNEEQVADILIAAPALIERATRKRAAFEAGLHTHGAPKPWIDTARATYDLVINLARAAMQSVEGWPDYLGDPYSDPRVRGAASRMERSLLRLLREGGQDDSPLRYRIRTNPRRKATLKAAEYHGKQGRTDHITRYEEGTIPTSEALKLHPPHRYHKRREWKEKDGKWYFGNYSEAMWNEFLEDIRNNGIKTPLWIQVDPGIGPLLMEGNHRVQAAAQLGLTEVPVTIKYYGLAEEEGLVAPSVKRTITHQDPERRSNPDTRGKHRY